MQAEKRIKVIGVGNILHGDDGLGVHAINLLRQEGLPAEVILEDGGVAGIDLLYMLEDMEYAFIIDCLDAGEEPGAMFRVPWEEIADSAREDRLISMHQIDLWAVLSLAERRNKMPKVIIYGIQPENMDFGQGLSPTVEKAASSLVKKIKEEIYQVYSILK